VLHQYQATYDVKVNTILVCVRDVSWKDFDRGTMSECIMTCIGTPVYLRTDSGDFM